MNVNSVGGVPARGAVAGNSLVPGPPALIDNYLTPVCRQVHSWCILAGTLLLEVPYEPIDCQGDINRPPLLDPSSGARAGDMVADLRPLMR